MRSSNGVRTHAARGIARATLIAAFCLWAGAAAANYLRVEPPMGRLKPGQRVLVDDGTCPKGKVKEVIGGDHVKVGGKAMIERKRRCIAK
jgi:hypothetical protein